MCDAASPSSRPASYKTPPADDKGNKKSHSPWSAPHSRRKRNKNDPWAQTISEDVEYTSPPKRFHDGSRYGGRDLGMEPVPSTVPSDLKLRLQAAGPLAQGLFLPGQLSQDDVHDFSPLGSAMEAPRPFPAPAAPASPSSPPPSSPTSEPEWVLTTPRATLPPPPNNPLPEPWTSGTTPEARSSTPGPPPAPPPSASPSAPQSRTLSHVLHSVMHSLSCFGEEPDPRSAGEGGPSGTGGPASPRLGAAACSPAEDALAPLWRRGHARSSWTSPEEASPASRGRRERAQTHAPSQLGRQPPRGSAGGERLFPEEGNSGRAATSGSSRPGGPAHSAPQSPGGHARKPLRSCFMCPSPFARRSPGAGAGGEDEVVTRGPGGGGDAVPGEHLHGQLDWPQAGRGAAVVTSRDEVMRCSMAEASPAGSSSSSSSSKAGFRLRGREAWNSPSPSRGKGMAEASPARASPSLLDSGPQLVELLTPYRDGEFCMSIDALNDLLKKVCTMHPPHPKDVEDFVQEACQMGSMAPAPSTLRTLDKLWAAHEQLHG